MGNTNTVAGGALEVVARLFKYFSRSSRLIDRMSLFALAEPASEVVDVSWVATRSMEVGSILSLVMDGVIIAPGIRTNGFFSSLVGCKGSLTPTTCEDKSSESKDDLVVDGVCSVPGIRGDVFFDLVGVATRFCHRVTLAIRSSSLTLLSIIPGRRSPSRRALVSVLRVSRLASGMDVGITDERRSCLAFGSCALGSMCRDPRASAICSSSLADAGEPT